MRIVVNASDEFKAQQWRLPSRHSSSKCHGPKRDQAVQKPQHLSLLHAIRNDDKGNALYVNFKCSLPEEMAQCLSKSETPNMELSAIVLCNCAYVGFKNCDSETPKQLSSAFK